MNIKGCVRGTEPCYSGGLSIYTTQDVLFRRFWMKDLADPSNYPDYVQYAFGLCTQYFRTRDGEEVNYSKENVGLVPPE